MSLAGLGELQFSSLHVGCCCSVGNELLLAADSLNAASCFLSRCLMKFVLKLLLFAPPPETSAEHSTHNQSKDHPAHSGHGRRTFRNTRLHPQDLGQNENGNATKQNTVDSLPRLPGHSKDWSTKQRQIGRLVSKTYQKVQKIQKKWFTANMPKQNGENGLLNWAFWSNNLHTDGGERPSPRSTWEPQRSPEKTHAWMAFLSLISFSLRSSPSGNMVS